MPVPRPGPGCGDVGAGTDDHVEREREHGRGNTISAGQVGHGNGLNRMTGLSLHRASPGQAGMTCPVETGPAKRREASDPHPCAPMQQHGLDPRVVRGIGQQADATLR